MYKILSILFLLIFIAISTYVLFFSHSLIAIKNSNPYFKLSYDSSKKLDKMLESVELWNSRMVVRNNNITTTGRLKKIEITLSDKPFTFFSFSSPEGQSISSAQSTIEDDTLHLSIYLDKSLINLEKKYPKLHANDLIFYQLLQVIVSGNHPDATLAEKQKIAIALRKKLPTNPFTIKTK